MQSRRLVRNARQHWKRRAIARSSSLELPRAQLAILQYCLQLCLDMQRQAGLSCVYEYCTKAHVRCFSPSHPSKPSSKRPPPEDGDGLPVRQLHGTASSLQQLAQPRPVQSRPAQGPSCCALHAAQRTKRQETLQRASAALPSTCNWACSSCSFPDPSNRQNSAPSADVALVRVAPFDHPKLR